MKIPLLLASFGFLQSASAEFENWANKDGKSAELELIVVEEKDGGRTGEFVTRAGKTVSLKDVDLASESAAKLKARKATRISYDFGSKSGPGSQDPFASEADEQKSTPGANFGFLVTGENLAGIKTSGEAIDTFKTEGGSEWKSAKRKFEADPAPATMKAAGGSREARFRLFIEGDHSEDELRRSQMRGTVVAVFGSDLKTTEAKLQLKPTKIDGWTSATARIGPFEVQVDQTNPFGDKIHLGVAVTEPKARTKKEEVPADPFGRQRRLVEPTPLRIARIDLVTGGKKIENMKPPFLHEGAAENGEVTVILQYWTTLHEKKMSFEKLSGQFAQVP